jgi:hypothetical protein
MLVHEFEYHICCFLKPILGILVCDQVARDKLCAEVGDIGLIMYVNADSHVAIYLLTKR